MWQFTGLFFKVEYNLLVTRVFFFFLWHVAFAMAILDLIFRGQIASSAIMLPKQMKYSTFSVCF
jgi:hypothetical protein